MWISKEGRAHQNPPVPPNGEPCAHLLAIFVDFLTVRPSPNRSPQSTPHPRSLQVQRMFFFAASPSSPEHFSDIPISTPYPFRPLITSVHHWLRSTSGTRSTIIPRVFGPRGCPFQVGLFPFVQTLYCLLMWDAGRSMIAMPWKGGSVPPIQRGHSSLSFPSFSVLFFF